MIDDFLDVFIDTVESACNLGVNITTDELRTEGGIYAEIGEGFCDTEYYNKGTVKSIPVLLLCRNASQKQCIKWLSGICSYLSHLKKYPDNKEFAWLNAAISKEPSKIGRDEDGVYHYSCIITCLVYCS